MNYLLDTCFVSESIKPAPNAGVLEWTAAQRESNLYLSVISVGELRAGFSKLPDSHRKAKLRRWLEVELLPSFEGRILDVDLLVASEWGEIRGAAAARGQVLPLADSQLAATAIVHGLTVVTRNVADFQRCGAMTLNPWR